MIERLEADLDDFHEKPGRSFEPVGDLRHGMKPSTDRREVEKQGFIKELDEKLNKNIENFDKLAIFAPDKMLSDLKKGLSKATQGKIFKTFNKNLLDFKDNELEKYVVEHLIKLD